ncbi:MAG TPA: DUF6457 domain-containing protein [Gaiellaceae bacterium]|jgi:hypothetical protein|nr:DUF6457 domain-containing protein [Gaiellaceae bacterium]
MDGWLEEARAKLARQVGEDPAAYDLTEEEATELLDLARIAAHDSGERTSAPLLCYLVGLAHGRHGGDLSDLVDATVGSS